jgi:hypothetical protein
MAVLGIYSALTDAVGANRYDNNQGFEVYEYNSYPTINGKTTLFEILALFDVTVLSFIDISKSTSTTTGWFTNLESIYSTLLDKTKVLVAAAFYSGTGAAGTGALDTFLLPYTGRQCAVVRCNGWDTGVNQTSLMPHYINGIDTPYVSPFTYVVKRNGAGVYVVTDKLNFIGTYNGEAGYATHSNLIGLDWMKIVVAAGEKDSDGTNVGMLIDPADIVSYIKQRVTDNFDAPKILRVYPDSLCTSEGGGANARVRLGSSKLRFFFSEKAMGPKTASNYKFVSGGTHPISSVTGDVPDTNLATPGALRASLYLSPAGAPNERESWVGTFDPAAGIADGTTITFDPTALLDCAGAAFTLDPNDTLFKFKVDTSTTTPTLSVVVKIAESGVARETTLTPGADSALILATAAAPCTLSVSIVTQFPGITPPSAILGGPVSKGLTFLSNRLVANTETLGAAGSYTLTVSEYKDGTGLTANAAVYAFTIQDASSYAAVPLNATKPDVLEGWGYFPREEGTPDNCLEALPAASFLGPDAATKVPQWTGSIAAAGTIVAATGLLAISYAGGVTAPYYYRGYPYVMKNTGSTGDPWTARGYIEARLKAGDTPETGGTAYNVATPAQKYDMTGVGLRIRNGPYCCDLVLLRLHGGTDHRIGIRVHQSDTTARAYAISPAGVDWTSFKTIRVTKTLDASLVPSFAVTVSGIAAAGFTVKVTDLPRVIATDSPSSSVVAFGVLDKVGQSLTATFDFVRYAFYDQKYEPGAGVSQTVGFPDLRRSTDSAFFRSPNILFGIGATIYDATDPRFTLDSTALQISARVTRVAAGALNARGVAVKVRFCVADFDDTSEVSIAGFDLTTPASIPTYNNGTLKPVAGTSSVAAVAIGAGASVTVQTGSVSWTADVGARTRTARRLFILAYTDAPLLGPPGLVDGADVTAWFARDAGGARGPDPRGVIRQFLPDYYILDMPGDASSAEPGMGAAGQWLCPDVALGVFRGPHGGGHATPDPRALKEDLFAEGTPAVTVKEANYPLGFAQGCANDTYLNTLTPPSVQIDAYDAEANIASKITISETGFTDYDVTPDTQCYYNRIWVRLSNRGIVPGPANVQVFFLDTELLRNAFTPDAARPALGLTPLPAERYRWIWSDPVGQKFVQSTFQRYTPSGSQYIVDMVRAVPALSGWSKPAPREFVIAELIWHVDQAAIPASTIVHGCRAVCINLPDPVPETGEASTSGIDTVPAALVPATPVSIWGLNAASNNIAVRNADIVQGAPPPPPAQVNVKCLVDPEGDPLTHRKLPSNYRPGAGTPNIVWGIGIDAKGFPVGELILRVPMEIAAGAKPDGALVEVFPKIVVPHGKKPVVIPALPYRYFLLPGGAKGQLQGIRVEKGGNMRAMRKGVNLCYRPVPDAEPGVYPVTIMQLANGKTAGGYRTTIVILAADKVQFVTDDRTKIAYDAKKYPQAFDAIPVAQRGVFAGAGFAMQEGIRFGPVDSVKLATGKLKNEIVNVPLKYVYPSAPTEIGLLPEGREGAIVGRVVDQKGNGVAGLEVAIQDAKLHQTLGTDVTDFEGRYLVTVAARGKTIPTKKGATTVALSVRILGSKNDEWHGTLTPDDLCFAMKEIRIKR